jgi:hypothetical protein
MNTASNNFTLFGCFLLFLTCLSAAQDAPLSSASGPGNPVTPLVKSTEDEGKKEFKRLVDYLGVAKCVEKGITKFENSAKCPFRALTFDGLTHVICDFSNCRQRVCPGDCRQAYAYLNLSTQNITTEEPSGDYQKVYIGCIFEEKHGIETPKRPKLI